MSSSIPYFDLTRQYAKLKDEINRLLIETAASGRYVLGPAVENFETAFASYIGTSRGVSVGSGTDALTFALRGLGIGKGDQVIVPSFTFSASVLCVLQVGATPVFADVNPETFTLAPEAIQTALTKRTKAIIPVHLYGQCADMTSIMKIARKHNLKVVEDACQAHGARFQNQKAGSFGDAGCFSFYPTKNLGAMGDGGMLVTRNQRLAEQALRYRNLGRRELKDPHQELGWTSRLDGMQAVILDLKLRHLDTFNEDRRRIAAHYFKRLQKTPLILPREAEGGYHVYHLFVARVPEGKRDSLRQHLQSKNIQTMLHYPLPVHRQPFAKSFPAGKDPLKITNRLSKEIISFPMFPEMTLEEADQVADAVLSYYHAR